MVLQADCLVVQLPVVHGITVRIVVRVVLLVIFSLLILVVIFVLVGVVKKKIIGRSTKLLPTNLFFLFFYIHKLVFLFSSLQNKLPISFIV